MSICNKIKHRRQELGLTLKDVATSLGVAESTVSRWETVEIRNMGKDKIVALSSALQCPIEYLLDSTCGERIQATRKSSKSMALDEPFVNIGERVRNARIALGISQEELAFRLGYNGRSSINKIENNIRGISAKKLIDLANALNVTSNYLLGIDEETPDDIIPLCDSKSIENEIKMLILQKYDSLSSFCKVIDMPWSTLNSILERGVVNATFLNVIKITRALQLDIEHIFHTDSFSDLEDINSCEIFSSTEDTAENLNETEYFIPIFRLSAKGTNAS